MSYKLRYVDAERKRFDHEFERMNKLSEQIATLVEHKACYAKVGDRESVRAIEVRIDMLESLF